MSATTTPATIGSTVTTVEQLDALPDLSVVLNQEDAAWQKRGGHGKWYVVGSTGSRPDVPYGPATVLYMPGEQPRPFGCCGKCPPIEGGGYDCTCEGNPRCPMGRAGIRSTGRAKTTAATVDAARAMCDVVHPTYIGVACSVCRDGARVLKARGLLATARPETTTEWAVCHEINGVVDRMAEGQARAFASGWEDVTLVRREVTAWTEAE